MNQLSGTPSPEPSTWDAGRWIGRVMIAVILGEGIWGLIVAVTNNLILPLVARIMGGDVQSPLYLGKGDINLPALFMVILELCFAGLVAVALNSWVQRKPRVIRTKPASPSVVPARPSAPPPSPRAVMPAQAAPSTPPRAKEAVPVQVPSPSAAPPSEQYWSPPSAPEPKAGAQPQPPTVAAKPAKLKPKEVYYNIVGEPINPTEDD